MMRACILLGIALATASTLLAGGLRQAQAAPSLSRGDAPDSPRDIFGGIITKKTKLDKWCRGTIKTVGDCDLVSAEGGFEPGALKGRVINPNFERPLGVADEDTRKKYGDVPQFSVKYYRIVDNTENTIRTDPAEGKPGTWDDEDRDYGDAVTGMRAAHAELLSRLKEHIEKGRSAAATQPSAKDPLNWVPEDQY